MAVNQEIAALSVSLALDSGNFQKSISAINGQLKNLDRDLQSASRGIDNFDDSMEGLTKKLENATKKSELYSQKLDLQRKAHEKLQEKIQSQVTKLNEIEQTLGRGSEEWQRQSQLVQQNSQRYNRLTSDINQTEGRLSEVNRVMGDTQRRMGELAQSTQEASTRFGQFRQRVQDAGERLRTTGEKMKTAGENIAMSFGAASAAIGAGLGDSVKKAADFEQQMSNIKAVSGASGKEMEKMGRLAQKMGADTKYSSMEAAQGIEELIKSGLTPAQIQAGGLEGALSLATAGGLELKDAAEIASTALNAFKDDNLSVAKAADILAGAANASATDVGELKFGLSAVSAVASGVGMSFKDTSTALAVFAQNGLKGQDAGTSLKTMLLNLSPHSKQAADQMAELGISTNNASAGYQYLVAHGLKPASASADDVAKGLEKLAKQHAGAKASAAKVAKEYDQLAKYSGFASSAFYDQNGKLKSLSDISLILGDKLKGLNNEQRQMALQTMFGTDAVRAANILYKSGTKEAVKNGQAVSDMAKSMMKVKSADVAKEKMNNFKGSVEQLHGSIETAQIGIGNALLPVLKKLADGLTVLVNKFNSLSPHTQKFIAIGAAITAIILGIVAVIGVFLVIIGSMATGLGAITAAGGLWTMVGTAMTTVTTALGAAFTFLTGPIGLAILAGMALVAVGVLIYKNWDTIIAWCKKLGAAVAVMWKEMATWFSQGFAKLSAWTSQHTTAIGNWFSNAWHKVSQTTVNLFNGIADFFKKWGTTILVVLSGPIGWAAAYIYTHWNQIKSSTISIWDSVKSAIVSVWNGIKSFISGAVSGVKSTISSVWSGIQNILTHPFQAAQSIIEGILGSIKKGVSFVKGLISGKSLEVQTSVNAIKPMANTVATATQVGVGDMSTSISDSLTSVGTSLSELDYYSAQYQANKDVSKFSPSALASKNNNDNSDLLRQLIEVISQQNQKPVDVAVQLDGKTIAKASARYMNNEIGTINKKGTRLGGIF